MAGVTGYIGGAGGILNALKGTNAAAKEVAFRKLISLIAVTEEFLHR